MIQRIGGLARLMLYLGAMATAPSSSMPNAPAPVAGVGATATESPPALLPGAHFAAAFAFFAFGGLGLVAVAPDLAKGAFFLPQVAAVVHLFVLGWITLSIFGALCQFLPVAVGQRLRWEPLAYVSLVAQVVGLLLFVGGLLLGIKGMLHGGAAALSLAFCLFGLNMGAALAKSEDRSLTWWALVAATIFLLATPVYGFTLALNLQGDVALSDRFGTVGAHAHVAVVGFFLLVMVGVSHRLLPMFLLSHGASEKPGWVAVWALTAGAGILALPLAWAQRPLVAGALIAVGVVAYLLQALGYFKKRVRKGVDPGIQLAVSGLVGLVLALLLAPFALSRGISHTQLLTTYFITLVGAVTLFVSGHHYKIIPFIVWFHRFGPLVGKQKVPKVGDLWSEGMARTSGILLVVGLAGLAVSVYAGLGWVARLCAVSFFGGAVVQIIAIRNVMKRRST